MPVTCPDKRLVILRALRHLRQAHAVKASQDRLCHTKVDAVYLPADNLHYVIHVSHSSDAHVTAC